MQIILLYSLSQEGQYAVEFDDPVVANSPKISTEVESCDCLWTFWLKFPSNPYGDQNEFYVRFYFVFGDGKWLHTRLEGNAYRVYDGAEWYTIQTLSTDTWYKVEWQVDLWNDTSKCYIDGVDKGSYGLYDCSTTASKMYFIAGNNRKGRYYLDSISLRKFVSPEPSVTIGDETTVPIPNGTFTSSVIDASKKVSWETITWNATTSPSTAIKFQLSSSVDGVSWTNFVGPDGDTGTYYTTSGNQIWQGHDGARYIKYKAYLETTDASETPYLNNVSIGYKYYPTVGDYSNCQYYRLINISNSTSTDLTDYQIKIELSTSTFNYSKVNSDGSDIRFYQEDGVKLNYWIESWDNTGTSTIWVKVPSIPGNSTTTIYMYYGNPDATSESNADNTFIFFDCYKCPIRTICC